MVRRAFRVGYRELLVKRLGIPADRWGAPARFVVPVFAIECRNSTGMTWNNAGE